MTTEIRTARLLLRPPRPDDLDDLHRVMADPDAMRYWSTLPHAQPAQTAAFIADMRAAPRDRSVDFVVVHEGRVIGKAGFFQLPEIGFLLHPDAWGRGFAREMLTALIAHGFTGLGLARITADVDPHNARCIRLLSALGFTETHRAANTFLIGGRWHDSVYFALDRPAAGRDGQ